MVCVFLIRDNHPHVIFFPSNKIRSLSLLTNLLATRLPTCLKRSLEGVQFILSVFTFVWIMFGYAWLIESWYYDSNAIPLRYKILFLGILIMFT